MKNSCVMSSVVRDVVHGTIQMSEPKLSVIVIIQSNPLSTSKGPIKSIATKSPHLSGTGNGGVVQLV